MARHVNHFDVQDRIMARNKTVSQRSGSLVERDPATLTIAEQEQMVKDKIKAKIQSQPKAKPDTTIRFTGKKH